jgi:hypothetical protein
MIFENTIGTLWLEYLSTKAIVLPGICNFTILEALQFVQIKLCALNRNACKYRFLANKLLYDSCASATW